MRIVPFYRTISIIFLLGIFLHGYTPVFSQSIQACTHYVSLEGNNANSGTSTTSAWQTIQHGIDHTIAGNVLCIRAGIYFGQVFMHPEDSGTPNSPKVIQSYPDETAVIDCSNCNQEEWSGIFNIHANHIILKNLEIRNSDMKVRSVRALDIYGNSLQDQFQDVKLLNLHVHHSMGAVSFENMKNVEVVGGIFHDLDLQNNPENRKRWSDPGTGGGIYFTRVTGGLAKDLIIHDVWGEVIGIDKGSTYVTVDGVTAYNFMAPIYANRSANITFSRNLIVPNKIDAVWTSRGIGVANENEQLSLGYIRSGDILIENNIIVYPSTNSGLCLDFPDYDNVPYINVNVRNNTLLNCTVIGGSPGNHQNFIVENNIFINGKIESISSSVQFKNNLWDTPPSTLGQGPGSVYNTDPKLVNATAVLSTTFPPADANNYKLSVSSPAIDTAGSNAPSTDIFGTPRPNGKADRGAHEFINTTVTLNPPSCLKKPLGDANCDNKMDLLDFEIWRKEFMAHCKASQLSSCGTNDDNILTAMDADFNDLPEHTLNNEKGVTIIDFEIWRKSFL